MSRTVVIPALVMSAYLGGGLRTFLAQSTELPRAYAAFVQDVAKALRWEPSEAPDRLKAEEVRVWFGFGEEWPNTVLRLHHGSDSMVGELVFWWRKGHYARSIRESLLRERGCSHEGKGKRVEVCRLTIPRNWRAVWDSLQARQIPALAMEAHPESDSWTPEGLDMAVEYWSVDSYRTSVHRLSPQEPHANRLACTFRAVLVPNDEMPKELPC